MTPLHATITDFSRSMFSTAPGTSSIIIFASMCYAPFAGELVDRIGRRDSLMFLGATGLLFAILLKRADARAAAPLEHPQPEAS